MAEEKHTARGWFGLNDTFDWRKARPLGPLLTVIIILLVLGLFSLAILAAFKLLGTAVFSEVPQDGFAKFGLSGIIVAMIGAPFVVWRSVVAQNQVNLVDQALTNDKMDNAVSDLHAQRQVTLVLEDNKEHFNGWEDDITRRNGAIDRFLGLVEENNSLRPRVDRMLTVYLRELTREFPPEPVPEGATPSELRIWAKGLSLKRSDMENAVQALSRLPRPVWQEGKDRLPDLQGINMQKCNLAGLILQNAKLQMAQLQGADLIGAQLQGADLIGAKLQGADLIGAQFDPSTKFTDAMPDWAAVMLVDFTDIPQITKHLNVMFGDRSVTLPQGVDYPAHWPDSDLEWEDFHTKWRAWQRAGGFDPDNPQ